MTATVDLDLSHLLCRYVIDQDGGLQELPLEEALAQGKCGVESTPSTNRTGGSGGSSTSRTSTSSGGFSVLDDIGGRIVEQSPQGGRSETPVGVPDLPEVAQ
jgi:phospholipid/cholesterol/gamma-HCH transport system substrate-binding protein